MFQKLSPVLRALFVFRLPTAPDVELPALSAAPCLPACHHATSHDENGLNL